jgi:hypothetical protein
VIPDFSALASRLFSVAGSDGIIIRLALWLAQSC